VWPHRHTANQWELLLRLEVLQNFLGVRCGIDLLVDLQHLAIFSNHDRLPAAQPERFGQRAVRIGEETVWRFIRLFELGEHVGGIFRSSVEHEAFFFEVFSFITEAADFGRSPTGERFGEEEDHDAFFVFE
jgi:hypothetical protein